MRGGCEKALSTGKCGTNEEEGASHGLCSHSHEKGAGTSWASPPRSPRGSVKPRITTPAPTLCTHLVPCVCSPGILRKRTATVSHPNPAIPLSSELRACVLLGTSLLDSYPDVQKNLLGPNRPEFRELASLFPRRPGELVSAQSYPPPLCPPSKHT